MKNKKFMYLGLVVFGVFLSFNHHSFHKKNIHYQESILNSLTQKISVDNSIDVNDLQLIQTVSVNDIKKDMKDNLIRLDIVPLDEIIESTTPSYTLQVSNSHTKTIKKEDEIKTSPSSRAKKINYKNLV